MMAQQDTIKLLQQTGYKLTNPRREILSTLTSTPMSAQEIFGILRQKGIKTDIVTIYRNLDLLTNLEFVRKTNFGDKTARYELLTNQDHHHHLICENCGSIEDVPLNEKVLVKQVEKLSRFKVERHNLEFFGYCARCQ